MNAYKIAIEAIEAVNKSEINGREFEERIAPLRDVESVVRCKDCRKRGTIMCHLWFNSPIPKDSWFCADGERKDDTH